MTRPRDGGLVALAGLFLFISPVSLGFSHFAFGFLAVAWVARLARGRRLPARLGLVVRLFLPYWLCLAAYALAAGSADRALEYLRWQLHLLPLVVFLDLEPDRAQVRLLCGLFVLSNLLICLLGMVHYSPAGPIFMMKGGARQFSGYMKIPISYSEILRTALVLLAFVAGARRGTAFRLALVAVTAALSFGLFMTTTRAAWITLAVCLLARFARPVGRANLALILAAIALAFPLVNRFDAGRLSSRLAETAEGYSSGREVLYRVGWEMVRTHPLLGWGAGAVGTHYNALVKSLPGIDTVRREMHYEDLHNNLLQHWAEFGLAGLLSLAWIYWGVAGRLLRSLPSAPVDDGDDFRFSVLLLFFGWFAFGLFSCNLHDSEVCRLVWAFVGLALGRSQPDGGGPRGPGAEAAEGPAEVRQSVA